MDNNIFDKYGFTESDRDEMNKIFIKYPNLEKVILFGSRAKNTFKPASDVDLAIVCSSDWFDTMSSVKYALEEDSKIPYFFDIVDLKKLSSEELKEHIRRYGKIIYEKKREWWVETTLGEIALINPTESLSKGKFTKCVPMDCIDPFTRQIARFEEKEFNGGMKFKNGDTLLARITPCLENGKTAYVDFLDENEIGFGSTEYIVIREKESLSDKKFLYYLAISPSFREIAIKAMTGTSGRQRVQTDVLINKSFFLPPLPEQQAIASILSSFDNKIEFLKEQNKILEEIAQSIFKEWFVNFNFPWSIWKMIDSELGEIPEGWRVGTLGEFNIHIKDNIKPFQSPNDLFYHYSIPDFDQWEKPSITKGSLILSNKYKVHSMSFLVSKINPKTPRIWMIFESENNWICSTEFQVIKPKELNFFAITYSILNSNLFIKKLSSKAKWTSSSHQRVSPDDILNTNVVIPNEFIINKYQELIFPILNKIDKNKIQIQTLSSLRDELLPKLMSGKIRVKF